MGGQIYLSVSTFQHAVAHPYEDRGRQGTEGDHSYARLADPVMVPPDHEETVTTSYESPQQLPLLTRDKENTPLAPKLKLLAVFCGWRDKTKCL